VAETVEMRNSCQSFIFHLQRKHNELGMVDHTHPALKNFSRKLIKHLKVSDAEFVSDTTDCMVFLIFFRYEGEK